MVEGEDVNLVSGLIGLGWFVMGWMDGDRPHFAFGINDCIDDGCAFVITFFFFSFLLSYSR